MKYLRRFALFLASSMLVSLLVATATLSILNNTIGDRKVVKEWFVKSGFYENFVNEVVSVSAQQSANDPEASDISTAVLKRAAGAAFTPEFLQSTLETSVNGAYNWLEGKTSDLQISIDLTKAKNDFAGNIIQEVGLVANSLPQCSTVDTSQAFDVFNAVCIPPDVNPAELANQFGQDILSGTDFLPDPVINANDIKVDSGGIQTPITEVYKSVPSWYRRATSLVWAFAFVTLSFASIIVFLAKSKRRGLKRLIKSLFLAAFSVSVFGFISQKLPLSTMFGLGGSTQGFSEHLLVPFIKQVLNDFARWSYILSGIYIGIAAILLVIFIVIKKKNQKPIENQENTKQKLEMEEPPVEDLDENRLDASPEDVNKTSKENIIQDIKKTTPTKLKVKLDKPKNKKS